jgi:hypothetical protein
MKKIILVFAFFFIGFTSSNAQVAKIVKSLNEAGDVASFELDCSQGFPVLAKGLRYSITRHEFKGVEQKNIYRLLLVMDGFYTNILNSQMAISAELSDGTVTTQVQTIETDGYFDGACTLKMNLITAPVKLTVKKIIVHADKVVVYTISEKNASQFTKNLNNIFEAK